jgi:hypothetical protein
LRRGISGASRLLLLGLWSGLLVWNRCLGPGERRRKE